MPEEAESETFALGGSLDDSWDVRHAEGLSVAVGDDAEVGYEGRERVVGDFGLGSRDDREERGLAGIREAHESDVGEDLKLEDGG